MFVGHKTCIGCDAELGHECGPNAIRYCLHAATSVPVFSTRPEMEYIGSVCHDCWNRTYRHQG